MNNYDFITEDNFYVRYINQSLDGEIRKYQKQYYGIRDHKKYSRCKCCGAIIEKTNNRVKYCKECGKIIDREKALVRMKKLREKQCSI